MLIALALLAMRTRPHNALALLAALSTPARAETSFTGILTDILCWDRVVGLDGANMQTEPEKHTVHCLRDIPACIESGYGVLEKPDGADKYVLKYTLDETGNKNALELLGKTTARANFVVTVTGEADGAMLSSATIVEFDGSAADEAGADREAESTLPAPTVEPRRSPEPLLVAHIACMLLSWAFLLPWAITAARVRSLFPGEKAEGAAGGSWLRAHRFLGMSGWALMLTGFAAIVAHVQALGRPHFVSGPSHAAAGLAAVALGALQPLNALLRPPRRAEGAQSGARRVWAALHTASGYAGALFGVVAIMLGVQLSQALGYSSATATAAGALAALGLLPPLGFGALAAASPSTAQPVLRALFRLGGPRDGEEEQLGSKASAAKGVVGASSA